MKAGRGSAAKSEAATKTKSVDDRGLLRRRDEGAPVGPLGRWLFPCLMSVDVVACRTKSLQSRRRATAKSNRGCPH